MHLDSEPLPDGGTLKLMQACIRLCQSTLAVGSRRCRFASAFRARCRRLCHGAFWRCVSTRQHQLQPAASLSRRSMRANTKFAAARFTCLPQRTCSRLQDSARQLLLNADILSLYCHPEIVKTTRFINSGGTVPPPTSLTALSARQDDGNGSILYHSTMHLSLQFA